VRWSNKFDAICAAVMIWRKKMITDEIKQTVMTRYGEFAETGGNQDSC
jgi:hypothetical protein